MSSSYNSISSFSTLPCLLSGVGAGVRPNTFNRCQETMIRRPNSVAPPSKKRRNQPGNPSPEADVIALSPETIMATNRFICEVCKKGFQREQNLQLHRRGHNLPWKLKQNSNKEVRRKVYVCPEPSCVHHDPSRALGDLTGIRKHYYRKHGEKTLECDKCSKRYAVESDLKSHYKTCGTKEYRCDCGTIFAGRDSYVMHREFCEALIQESATLSLNHFGNSSTSGFAPPAECYNLKSEEFVPRSANPNPGGHGNFLIQCSSNQGFYGSAASTLSHNHFGNSSTSGFAPLAAGYNLKSEEFIPRPVNPNPGCPANFGDANDRNLQGLMNSLAAPTDNQSWSGGLFDPGFGNNLSMGGSVRLNLDFLGVNGGNVSTINGRGGRNGAPLDTEMKFSLPNYPFGKP